MILAERTLDMELVRQIMTSPEIYPHISDDACPSAADFIPTDDQRIYYLVITDGDPGSPDVRQPVGIFMGVPQNAVTLEVHTCLKREAWGHSAMAATCAIRWIWANTALQRIVTCVPSYNRLARKLALCVGMKEYGRNPASFLKNGKLFDQIMLGIGRSDGLCPQL